MDRKRKELFENGYLLRVKPISFETGPRKDKIDILIENIKKKLTFKRRDNFNDNFEEEDEESDDELMNDAKEWNLKGTDFEKMINKKVKTKRTNRTHVKLEAKNLFKSYTADRTMIINNASLKIYKDDLFMIMGEDGAGKSTLMKMLYGQIRSSYGVVKVNHKKMNYWQWDGIARFFSVAPKDDYVFFDHCSVADHIELYTSICNTKENGYKLLNELNFTGGISDIIKDLDDINKRKLKIALALLKFKKYIFLEEPTTGMTEEDKVHFWNAIGYRKSQRTYIISTTSMKEATHYANRYIILEGGKVKNSKNTSEKLSKAKALMKKKQEINIKVE